ncbi:hypothetical protein ABZP36_006866 [Zizania latifolia]
MRGIAKAIRNVQIIDGRETLPVSLWGPHATQFDAKGLQAEANKRPVVMLFVGLTSKIHEHLSKPLSLSPPLSTSDAIGDGQRRQLRLPDATAHCRLSSFLAPHLRRIDAQRNLFFKAAPRTLAVATTALHLRLYGLDERGPSRTVLVLKRCPRIDAGVSRVEEVKEPLQPALAPATRTLDFVITEYLEQRCHAGRLKDELAREKGHVNVVRAIEVSRKSYKPPKKPLTKKRRKLRYTRFDEIFAAKEQTKMRKQNQLDAGTIYV